MKKNLLKGIITGVLLVTSLVGCTDEQMEKGLKAVIENGMSYSDMKETAENIGKEEEFNEAVDNTLKSINNNSNVSNETNNQMEQVDEARTQIDEVEAEYLKDPSLKGDRVLEKAIIETNIAYYLNQVSEKEGNCIGYDYSYEDDNCVVIEYIANKNVEDLKMDFIDLNNKIHQKAEVLGIEVTDVVIFVDLNNYDTILLTLVNGVEL